MRDFFAGQRGAWPNGKYATGPVIAWDICGIHVQSFVQSWYAVGLFLSSELLFACYLFVPCIVTVLFSEVFLSYIPHCCCRCDKPGRIVNDVLCSLPAIMGCFRVPRPEDLTKAVSCNSRTPQDLSKLSAIPIECLLICVRCKFRIPVMIQISGCWLCVTKGMIFSLKCTIKRLAVGLRPNPLGHWGTHSAPQILAGFRGWGSGGGRWGKGGRGWQGLDGKGWDTDTPFLQTDRRHCVCYYTPSPTCTSDSQTIRICRRTWTKLRKSDVCCPTCVSAIVIQKTQFGIFILTNWLACKLINIWHTW